MKDTFLTHNFDKLLLFILVLLTGGMILHMVHHQIDHDSLTWAENAFSTVLGALILILTGRLNRADGQTGNGAPSPATHYPPALPATFVSQVVPATPSLTGGEGKAST